LVDYRLLYSNHDWGPLEIENEIAMPEFEPFIGTIYYVRLRQICRICGSIRKVKAIFYPTTMRWKLFQSHILYSENYKASLCYKKWKERRKRRKRQLATRKYSFVVCPLCRQQIIDYNFEKHFKLCKKKKWLEEQIERNLKLIKKLKKSKKRIDVLRKQFAIYRLYRTCNWGPKEIATRLEMDSFYIQTIIGRVFRNLCLQENTCVFREIFAEGKQRVKNGEA